MLVMNAVVKHLSERRREMATKTPSKTDDND